MPRPSFAPDIIRKNLLLITAFLVTILPLQPAHPQDRSSFSAITWPFEESAFQISQDGESVLSLLESQWLEDPVFRLMGGRMEVVDSSGWSLETFTGWVARNHPVLIEGELPFVDATLAGDGSYRPVLYHTPPHTRQAALIERTDTIPLRVGVVSIHTETGGRAQLRHWLDTYGKAPPLAVLGAPAEVIRHLLVGSISHAAVPLQTLSHYLDAAGRSDLLSAFRQVELPTRPTTVAVYLREDIFTTTWKRTLIQETWLRSTAPDVWSVNPPDARTTDFNSREKP